MKLWLPFRSLICTYFQSHIFWKFKCSHMKLEKNVQLPWELDKGIAKCTKFGLYVKRLMHFRCSYLLMLSWLPFCEFFQASTSNPETCSGKMTSLNVIIISLLPWRYLISRAWLITPLYTSPSSMTVFNWSVFAYPVPLFSMSIHDSFLSPFESLPYVIYIIQVYWLLAVHLYYFNIFSKAAIGVSVKITTTTVNDQTRFQRISTSRPTTDGGMYGIASYCFKVLFK